MAEPFSTVALESVIDMSKWDPDMKQWFESCNSLRVLVVGRTGHGKSSFINALFPTDVAEVAQARDPTTMSVKKYERVISGVKLILFDSPGLQDGIHEDEEYIKNMKETCKVINLLLYCVRMDDQLRQNDKETIKTITKALGKDIWKHAMCVLTFANQVKPMSRTQGKPKEYFDRIFECLKRMVQVYVADATGCTVPVVASGHPLEYGLPVCKDWRNKLLTKAIEKCSNEGAIALLKSNWCHISTGGKYIGTTVAALFFGPIGVMISPDIAATIEQISKEKYSNHCKDRS